MIRCFEDGAHPSTIWGEKRSIETSKNPRTHHKLMSQHKRSPWKRAHSLLEAILVLFQEVIDGGELFVKNFIWQAPMTGGHYSLSLFSKDTMVCFACLDVMRRAILPDRLILSLAGCLRIDAVPLEVQSGSNWYLTGRVNSAIRCSSSFEARVTKITYMMNL